MDNLKQGAKDGKRSMEITRKILCGMEFFSVVGRKYPLFNPREFRILREK